VIKFIFKWIGHAKKAFSVYRILFIVGGVVVGFVVVQQARIKSKTKKIGRLEATIQTLEIEATQARQANEITNESLTACLQINTELTRQGAINQAANEQAIKDISESKKQNEIKTITLKERVYVNTCTINSNNIELLKKANNQN
jgi:hypothetical protein